MSIMLFWISPAVCRVLRLTDDRFCADINAAILALRLTVSGLAPSGEDAPKEAILVAA